MHSTAKSRCSPVPIQGKRIEFVNVRVSDEFISVPEGGRHSPGTIEPPEHSNAIGIPTIIRDQ